MECQPKLVDPRKEFVASKTDPDEIVEVQKRPQFGRTPSELKSLNSRSKKPR